jgi:hypothetical protein
MEQAASEVEDAIAREHSDAQEDVLPFCIAQPLDASRDDVSAAHLIQLLRYDWQCIR